MNLILNSLANWSYIFTLNDTHTYDISFTVLLSSDSEFFNHFQDVFYTCKACLNFSKLLVFLILLCQWLIISPPPHPVVNCPPISKTSFSKSFGAWETWSPISLLHLQLRICLFVCFERNCNVRMDSALWLEHLIGNDVLFLLRKLRFTLGRNFTGAFPLLHNSTGK